MLLLLLWMLLIVLLLGTTNNPCLAHKGQTHHQQGLTRPIRFATDWLSSHDTTTKQEQDEEGWMVPKQQQHQRQRRTKTNPIALGIQRAWKTRNDRSYSSSSRQFVSYNHQTNHREPSTNIDEEEEESMLLQNSHPTRFASVQHNLEASEIKATMRPHLKQTTFRLARRSSSETDNEQQQQNDDEDEESLLLDLKGQAQHEDSMIPCSVTGVHPAALQGKFRAQSPRRLTPSSATKTAEITTTGSSHHQQKSSTKKSEHKARGGSSATAVAAVAHRPLLFWENMVSGAVSRSVAQTIMHPANTMKTMLQSSRENTFRELFQPQMFRRLTVGAGANFVLSIPHGAVNFAVLEFVRGRLNAAIESIPFLEERKDVMGPGLDFMSSAISTITCSIVSTPQMMITDNIMAGNYPTLISATTGLYTSRGIMGFYSGWWPGLVGKIPSYALTWTFFQQLKEMRNMISDRPAKNYENTIMGCLASAATVCIMIPMDTIKTRLVTQTSAKVIAGTPYKGIVDCAVRIAQEEGIRTFYRGLAPRLISVVPMIGIQFGVYEAMKRVMLQRNTLQSASTSVPARDISIKSKKLQQLPQEMLTDRYGPEEAMEEAAMEVAADGSNTFPAPHFLKKIPKESKKGLKSLFKNVHFK